MKGIVVQYFEDKGFGFIKDENEENRFFHISSVKEKSKFINNLTEYFYSDWVERVCYVVTFTPGVNAKGLNASDIILTKQIFNDKSVPTFDARIIDIKYNTAYLTRVVSGIKQGKPQPLGATAGGNGTYRVGYPEVLRELNIYFRRVDNIGWGVIDVRDSVMRINSRSKITDKLIETLRNQIIGKTIKVVFERNDWQLADNSVLEV